MESSPSKRSITLLSAKDDHGVIRVIVRITGWKLAPTLVGKKPTPGTGHWHIYVNGKYNNFSARPKTGRTDPKQALAPSTTYTVAVDGWPEYSGPQKKADWQFTTGSR